MSIYTDSVLEDDYYEELREERGLRILRADAEACGVVWEPEGGDDESQD